MFGFFFICLKPIFLRRSWFACGIQDKQKSESHPSPNFDAEQLLKISLQCPAALWLEKLADYRVGRTDTPTRVDLSCVGSQSLRKVHVRMSSGYHQSDLPWVQQFFP